MSLNPVGLQGIDFVEFASPEPERARPPVPGVRLLADDAPRRARRIDLYEQSDIRFLLNREQRHVRVGLLVALHGPSICSMGWRVHDGRKALEAAVARGARARAEGDLFCRDGKAGARRLRDRRQPHLPGRRRDRTRAVGAARLRRAPRAPDASGLQGLPRCSTTSRTTSRRGRWGGGPPSTRTSSASPRSATSTSAARRPGSPRSRCARPAARSASRSTRRTRRRARSTSTSRSTRGRASSTWRSSRTTSSARCGRSEGTAHRDARHRRRLLPRGLRARAAA